MKINNKFKLKQEVYIGGESRIIYSIKVNVLGSLDYQLWGKVGNDYEWYEEWQIEEERKIGFNPIECDGKKETNKKTPKEKS